ncbi:MAG: tetratricopeptide repeat protein, partial [Myxococcales bacterium]|nr:tetratricopeptide repeat protein [Myxococcales bacterium]
LARSLPPDHPDLALPYKGRGQAALARGRFAAARDDLERALEFFEEALHIYEQAFGAEHHRVAFALTGMGQALIGLDRPAEAIPHLERALVIRTGTAVEPTDLAETRFALARALAAGEGDPARARELATLARDAYAADGDKSKATQAEVDAWLAARDP